jgi:hypothetical protein
MTWVDQRHGVACSRFHVPLCDRVDLEMAGDFDRLAESHRTCIYRVVQEGR